MRKVGFNGVDTIYRKTADAVSAGLGGVMIWEVRQLARLELVRCNAATFGVMPIMPKC